MPLDQQTHTDVYHYLNQVSPISKDTWYEITKIMKLKNYKRREHFARSGRREYHFGILLDGILRAFINNGKGSDYTKTIFTPIHFKTPISYVGAYTALVSGSINQVNIETLTPARLLVGHYDQWLDLIRTNQEVAEWSRKLSELFFSGKEKREFELITLQADERYRNFRNQFPEVEQQISQYYIAQFLGISATQLSRIRKKMFASS